jgi:hypothetical protein
LLNCPGRVRRAEAAAVLEDLDIFPSAAAAAAAAAAVPEGGLGVKQLLTALDLAHAGGPRASLRRFRRAVRACCADDGCEPGEADACATTAGGEDGWDSSEEAAGPGAGAL